VFLLLAVLKDVNAYQHKMLISDLETNLKAGPYCKWPVFLWNLSHVTSY